MFLEKKEMRNVPMSIFCLNLRRFPYPGTAALYLCPRVLGPCLWLCLQESPAHSWGCGLQVIRLAVHRVLPDFKNCTISCILSHIITTSPVILSCRCRISLLCVGHLRILPGAPPRDAGLGSGVSQPLALHAAFQTPAPSSHQAHGHQQHETNFLAAL